MPSVAKIFQLIKIIYISWLRDWSMLQNYQELLFITFGRIRSRSAKDKHSCPDSWIPYTTRHSHPILKIARRIYSRRIVFHNCAINHIYVATLCQSLIKFAIYQEIFIFTRQNNKSFHPREGNIFLNYCQQFLNYREGYSVIFSRQRKEMARY